MRAAPLIVTVLLAGCGGPAARDLQFQVTQTMPDGAQRPVPWAHVRAIPLSTGGVPLPVNDQTLPELNRDVRSDSGFTDDQGRVTLRIVERPTLVEVMWPKFATDAGERAGTPGWSGGLRAGGDDIIEDDSDGVMRVELVR
jgi:hypothetical protein